MNRIVYILGLSMLMTACGSQQSSETEGASEPMAEPKAEKTCTYSFDEANTEVLWVAYKYTEKTGVNGSFDEITFSGTSDSDQPQTVFSNATVSINTMSVNSGDPERDPKIKESFFGGMQNSDKIEAKVSTISGSETGGDISFNITMNGVSKDVSGTYTVEKDKLEAKVELSVNDWNAQDPLSELNRVCEDLHKGADGKSILWPDVTVFVTSTLKKTCE